jgi:hypothetical protein
MPTNDVPMQGRGELRKAVGLIQHYEDLFDPDWMSRHPRQTA